MEDLEDALITLSPEATRGYGRSAIPHPIDDVARRLSNRLAISSQDEKDSSLSLMTLGHGRVLDAFAGRMASLAVRTEDPHKIVDGLKALAFASRLMDWRDNVATLALLCRSIEILELDPELYLRQTAGLSDSEFEGQVRGFSGRDERDRSLSTFRYVEGEDRDGFRYLSVGAPGLSPALFKLMARGEQVKHLKSLEPSARRSILDALDAAAREWLQSQLDGDDHPDIGPKRTLGSSR
ncbi:hypothetical protein [Paludisphaera mucosa]|uniref:Uncharacterized protein n=1 Tax=Paludisphaera mucosa TaxID=3030827 RepID=A0ABT6F507_9BACT|nr:hypothetical protein [Paludisphaera mucosa]MDG3002661.1 hypothetical protein [Paludisphaera mucosa]